MSVRVSVEHASGGRMLLAFGAQGLVWTVVVVLPPPVFEQDLCFVEAIEGLEFEQLSS
jgi:hypothetical protein